MSTRLFILLLLSLPAVTQADPRIFSPDLSASGEGLAILREGRATALASADFDSDGVPDLAVAYSLADRGAVAVFRGEYAALLPHFPAAAARRAALGGALQPFETAPRVIPAEGPVELLAAGDFDADGHADLAWAGPAARLQFARGDGQGAFSAPTFRALPAAPHLLAALDLDLADGLPELVVAVDGPAARQLLRFGGPRGALAAEVSRFPLAEKATRLEAGRFDDDGLVDLAVGGADGWRLLQGRRPGEASRLEAAPDFARASPDPAAAASLAMRLDDNALADRVFIGADGQLRIDLVTTLASFTVNSTDDGNDGVCDAIHCSLREAILAANSSPGADAIGFALAGSPPYRIQPLTAMPFITGTVTLDGSTQPGFAGEPIVELHGGSVHGTQALRLTLGTDGSTIRSLIVNGFDNGPFGPGSAIYVTGSDSVIEGCYIGTDTAGAAAVYNGGGIGVDAAANRVRIGGTAAGMGNLLVAREGAVGLTSDDVRVEGNRIGTDRTGSFPIEIFGRAISAHLARGAVIGGTVAGAGNLISGANLGIWLNVGGGGHRVQGNRIGTDATGELAIPNEMGLDSNSPDSLVGGTSPAAANLISGNAAGASLNGLDSHFQGNQVGLSASGGPLPNQGQALRINGPRHTVGGTAPGAANEIAHNVAGIFCYSTAIRLLGNHIYGHNINSINNCQGAPVLTAASSSPAGTLVEGTWNGHPETDYRIEFFSSPACELHGSGQSQDYLGFQNVTTSPGGTTAYTFSTPIVVSVGAVLTAVATPFPLVPGTGDVLSSSNFSACRTVSVGGGGGGPVLSIPQHVPAAGSGSVTLPIDLQVNGHALGALAFSLDFGSCVSFDPADADADGIPDAVSLHLPAGWAASVAYQPGDGDGELDFAFFDAPPFVPAASGTIAELTLGLTCSTNTTPIVVPLPFSTAPAPSFGNTAGQSVAGGYTNGSIDILPGLRGDCNGDGVVDAGDLTACGLEIFDGDGDFWLDAPGGSFPGIPVGCDSNADTVIDAGDLACKIRLIFGLGCAGRDTARGAGPSLEPGAGEARGAATVVPISLATGGRRLVSAIFSLDLAPGAGFDATDADHDGIPDAIRVLAPGNLRSVSYDPNDTAGELDFILGDVAASPRLLAEGRLLEIELQAGSLPTAGLLKLAADPPPSFGTEEGASAAGALTTLFLDGFENGGTGAWSLTLP